jgi:hypothetical protein
MTNYVDLDELKTRTFFESATKDPRFVFEEVEPLEDDHGRVWSQFKIVDCAHRETDRDGDLCTHCGHAFAHKPRAVTKRAPRKPRGKK